MTPAERDLLPEMPAHLGPEFLLWLCWREAMDNHAYRLESEDDAQPVTVEVDGGVDLRRPEESSASVSLREVAVVEHPELLASLRAGRLLHRARLKITVDDRVYALTLTGPQLAWSGVSLPKLVKGDDEEALYEEMFLYEDLHRAVRGVFAQFARGRADKDRWSQEGRSIRAWVGEAFERVYHFDEVTGQGRLWGSDPVRA